MLEKERKEKCEEREGKRGKEREREGKRGKDRKKNITFHH
jgi:hypothetical protein